MTNYLNVTQHQATPDQVAAGLQAEPFCKELMNVPAAFTRLDIQNQAYAICKMIMDAVAASSEPVVVALGGHFDLMHYTALYLNKVNIPWVTAVSERVSEEVQQPDGTVVKVNKFKHLGFR